MVALDLIHGVKGISVTCLLIWSLFFLFADTFYGVLMTGVANGLDLANCNSCVVGRNGVRCWVSIVLELGTENIFVGHFATASLPTCRYLGRCALCFNVRAIFFS